MILEKEYLLKENKYLSRKSFCHLISSKHNWKKVDVCLKQCFQIMQLNFKK